MSDPGADGDVEFLHVCYVTRQYDVARSLLAGSVGVRSFLDLGVARIQTEAGDDVSIRLGLGYLGSTYVELIEPLSGPLDFYHEVLDRSAAPMTWHHCCYAVRSIERMRAVRRAHEAAGRAIVVASSGGDFFYVDTRSIGGHYTEYVFMDEKLIALHAAVRAAAGE